MKKLSLLSIFFMLAVIILSGSPLRAENKYAVMKLDGAVNPVVSAFLVDSIKKAGDAGASFIVIQMDTPGGLMDSMRDIIKAILTSPVPVVVYTYPKGAQAASAGGFIMLSSHIAVMAPGTEIGAMHPVSPALNFLPKDKEGGPAGVMEKKVLNDTIAYARSLAQKRKRNIQWTENAVRQAISSTYQEALKLGVIDLIAEDMDDLLVRLHNRKIDVNGNTVVINTKNIKAINYSMDWKQELMNRFADPQIIFLLFILAVVGIGMEFKNPGMIIPGVVGAISLFIFLMAIQIIPINVMGLILIIIAIVLFILELQIVSYGLLTIGGLIAFVLGSMILFDSPLPGGHIPMTSIIAAVVFVLGFVFIVVRLIINAHRERVTTGKEGLVGLTGRAFRDFSGRGKIMIHGELWNALCDEPVYRDEEVEVREVRGMDLVVGKKKPQS